MLISYQQLASLPTPGEYNIKEKKKYYNKGKGGERGGEEKSEKVMRQEN